MPSEMYGDNTQGQVDTPAQQGTSYFWMGYIWILMKASLLLSGATAPGSGSTVHEGSKVPRKDQAIGKLLNTVPGI